MVVKLTRLKWAHSLSAVQIGILLGCFTAIMTTSMGIHSPKRADFTIVKAFAHLYECFPLWVIV